MVSWKYTKLKLIDTYNGILFSNKPEQTIIRNVAEAKMHCLKRKEVRPKRKEVRLDWVCVCAPIHSVWVHVYDILEKAKLYNAEQVHGGQELKMGKSFTQKEVTSGVLGKMRKLICIFIEVGVTQVCICQRGRIPQPKAKFYFMSMKNKF